MAAAAIDAATNCWYGSPTDAAAAAAAAAAKLDELGVVDELGVEELLGSAVASMDALCKAASWC